MKYLVKKYNVTSWITKDLFVFVLLILLLSIEFIVAMDGTCDIRIDMLQSLAKDGLLRKNHPYHLSQWFYRKYPSCSSSNYLNMIIGEEEKDEDEENVKENVIKVTQNHLNDGNLNRKDTKKNRFLDKLNYDNVNNVNVDSYNNKVDVVVNKVVVFKKQMKRKENDGRYDDEKRRLNVNIGRSLIGEWDGAATSGTYILSNDVNTTGTITVDNGDALDITGIVGMDGTRPAIDGGGTPGCTSNCPGHRVFSVGHATSILNLTNVTIRNGYVCIIYLFHFQLLSSIMIIIILLTINLK